MFADGSRSLLVLGYLRAALLWLTGELQTCLSAQLSAPDAGDVELVESPSPNTAAEAALEQPPDSNVQFIPHATGFELRILQVEIWHGDRRMLFLGLTWCAAIGLATPIAATFSVGDTQMPTVITVLFVVFWCIGIAFLVAAINFGMRSVTFTVEADRVRIEK